MSTYCIIPDSVQTFAELLAELVLSDEDRDLLGRSTITKVQVDTDAAAWEVSLNVPEYLPDRLLASAAQHLTSHCQLSQVKFHQTPQNIEDYLTAKWGDLVNRIAAANHTVKHLLLPGKRYFDGHTLSIEISGELSVEILLSRGVDKAVKTQIAKEFGLTCEVVFVPTATEEVPICEDDYARLAANETGTHDASPGKKKVENPIIFGKNIKDNPISISDVQEEGRNITMIGQIISHDLRALKSGRNLLTFDLADLSGGISGKAFFEDKDLFRKLGDSITDGILVKVKGTVQYDKYANELVVFVDSMNRMAKTERSDTATTPRVELHAHTRMSALDSVTSVKSLIRTAAKWGHPAVAITDHGVVQSFPEADEEASKSGIKVIYGMEGYLIDENSNHPYHIIILAQNLLGLRNLYRLVSLSHLKYLHRTPRIPRAILAEHREGLLLGSACEAGEIIQAILAEATDAELTRLAEFYDYLEIQPTGNNAFLVRQGKVADEQGLRNINHEVCRLGELVDKPVVATCDVHFLNPEDEVYRRILMSGQGYDDADNQPPLFFRTTAEMLVEFSYLGEKKAYQVVVENTRNLNDSIDRFKPIPEELYSPKIPGAEDQIRNMSMEKAFQLYGDPLPELVATRLNYELDSIINHGFAVLYLIAHKLVKKSLDDGYLVGSRGSVGSSFVATMTDITEVNPLAPHWRCPKCKYSEFITDGSYGSGFDLPDKACPSCGVSTVKDGHDIPFAVFMGFHGDKVPDIDLNFSGEYQPIAHKYTEELFGKDNVFRAGTIATIADKTAYGFVKNYFSDKGIMPRNAHINHLIGGCTGVKRTTGQHPGGIMVVPRDMDIHHFTPIQYPADDKKSATITTHFDYHSISSRLVKLDILGHDDPTVIKMLEDLIGLDPKTIPFDDPATMSLFSSTEALGLTPQVLGSTVGTFGIPEFGTKFVRQMLEDTKPQHFSELVRISGFSHGTDVWLNNAQDLIRSGTAKLSEAISARDDIMIYLMHKGVEPSISFRVMEGVRKGKGVKSDDVEVMRQKSVPEWYTESCQKIKYMFPKAHAVAYVMMAVRIAYCKVHHPLAFYAAYFTVRATECDADVAVKGEKVLRQKLSELEQKANNTLTAKEKVMLTIYEMALEMTLRGFTFHHVDLYRSDASKFLIVDNGLLPPLAALDGVGGSAASNIVLARQGKPFSSIEDLRLRARVSKSVIDILQQHGCLDGLPENNQLLLFG
ncbi:MAG: PolC-type DNA polymerase III [Negativicutes bacterium]|nr:PolC-type DNA polymerase III [Negativicutes bacterium]